MQPSQYTNIAFISYKREDEEWAKWLQKKLENYRLPSEIIYKYPNKDFIDTPRHVFKDTTDLGGGVLAKLIKEGLDSSKFLIVICSPRSAKSVWVSKDVQDFIDSGREEYIIPFIIDGVPYAKNPDDECFPVALKNLTGDRELLGINVNEGGKDIALKKTVCRLFNLRYGLLIQPQSVLQRLKNILCKDTSGDLLKYYTPQTVNFSIFISYRREDGRDTARIIQQALKAHGFGPVFFDYDSIQRGEFNKRIIDAIYSCNFFLLLLSPKSMKRCSNVGDPVANEIRAALKYQKTIIPITIDNQEVKWPWRFPKELYFIRNMQYHDYRSDSFFEDSIEKLCNKLSIK